MLEELRDTFFEECQELLSALEESLNAMSDGDVEAEAVGSAFRAIHSVKGGAGTFGLTSLVDFSHHFENALDLVRAGKLEAGPDVMAVFLRANDIVIDLVDDARADVERASPERDAVLADIKRLTGHSDDAGDDDDLDALFEDDGDAGAPDDDLEALFEGDGEDAAAATEAKTYDILLAPTTDLFRRAIDINVIFEGLERLGALDVTGDASEIPELASLDPGANYLRWSCRLTTDVKARDIAGEFDLFLDDGEFSIKEAAPEPAEAPAETADPVAETDDGAAPASEPATAARKPARRTNTTTPTTIRVNLDRIDRMVNLVGEIVITQAMLAEIAEQLPADKAGDVLEGIQSLSRQSRELQESVMSVRAQPLKAIFSRLPRLTRELAASLGKNVRLEVHGEYTEVDKTVIEELADPLTHMLRNAMDHGVESPEERIAAGKPEEGLIKLSAEHRGGKILINLIDDGKGVNRERVLDKAVAAGIVDRESQLSAEEIDNLIFHPGLSTADKVSDVSGRGVGMDVVKRNIQKIGGRITVMSEPGVGSRFTLALPLTLAVLDGMVVRAGAERFVVPIASIVQSLRLTPDMVQDAAGVGPTLNYRGDFIPIYNLANVLDAEATNQDSDQCVVIVVENEQGQKLGLIADQIEGQQQVVIKSLEKSYRSIPGVSAATILGNGMVSLIVDIDALPALARDAAMAQSQNLKGAA